MGTPWVSFNGKDCSGCKHLNERGYCEFTACIIPCTVRATIPEVKPKTNGDNFRAMTDEELALFLEEVHKKRADFFKRCQRNCLGEDCYECWLEWLKKECK